MTAAESRRGPQTNGEGPHAVLKHNRMHINGLIMIVLYGGQRSCHFHLAQVCGWTAVPVMWVPNLGEKGHPMRRFPMW